jgi:branched-chain amino acid transport system ATP-binding protein
LLSEQNLHFAQWVSDRAYVLEKGQIRHESSMHALTENEEIRRNYLSV